MPTRPVPGALLRRAAILSLLALATACGGGGGGSTPADIAPSFGAGPSSLTVAAGGAATFTASATGTPTPAIRWQRRDGGGWTDLAGATGGTLTFAATPTDDGARFRAVAESTAGSATSAEAVLTVTYLIVDTGPADQVEEAPAPAQFTLSARGNPAPSYQWQRSTDGGATWADVPGATAASLALAATTLADDGARFRAQVANGVSPAVTSAAALLTVHTAPAIGQGPASLTVAAGARAAFSATATGNPAPSLQWQRSADGVTWSDVPGATGTTYALEPAAAGDDGARFRAVASNGVGAPAASAAATLTVTHLALTAGPESVTVNAPSQATFSAAATGTPAPSYQWQRSSNGGASWADISGATRASLVLSSTALADDGARFRVRVSNGVSADVTSAAAVLTVREGPAFTQGPASLTVAAGARAAFSVAVAGNPTPTLQWQRSADGVTWSDLPGATAAAYALDPAAAGDDGARFRVTASNGIGTPATSAAATLTVTHLRLVTSPASRTVVAPATATFSAAAEGTPAPAYQWQRSTDGGGTWSDLAGETDTSYVTPATALADDGARFRVRVSNGVSADVTSAAATLTVQVAPAVTASPQSAVVSDGDTVSFSVTATGNPAPTYQWQRSPDGTAWTAIAGATQPTLTLTAAAADDGVQLRAVVDNGVGAAISSDAASLGVRAVMPGHWERIADGPPVSQPAVAYDPVSGKAVLFGGSGVPAPAEVAIDQTWVWDSATMTWTQVFPAGNVPSARLAAGMAFDQSTGVAVLHGGWLSPDYGDPGHPPPGPGLGTYVYSLDTGAWSYRGDVLGPVDCYAVDYDTDAGRVRLFGGQTVILDPGQPDYGYSRYFDRVQTWLPETDDWTSVAIGDDVGVRAGARWAYDQSAHRFVLFGGGYPGWCGSFPCSYHQDTFEYDPASDGWLSTTNGDLQPPASGFFGMAYDPVRQRTVMYLGLAPGFQQLGVADPAPQTWEYDAAAKTWRRYRDAVQPGNLDAPALFYDEQLGAILLVGGATPDGMSNGTYRFVPGG